MRIHKEMVVAFVDILGTKQRKISEAENIYEMFQSFIKMNEDRQNNFSKSYSRKCWFFSDCTYLVYYQNGRSEEVSNLEVLRPMLINLSIELLKIWDEGFLVRGGIAVGEGCFHTDKPIFCGEVFNQASRFDCKDMPPCIFIAPELAEEFGRELQNAENYRLSQALPEFADLARFPEFILRDGDRYFLNALHYLEDSLISVGLDDRFIHPAQFVKKMGNHIENQIAESRAKGSDSATAKWEWMRAYLFARLCPFDVEMDSELCEAWKSCDDESKIMLLQTFEDRILCPPHFPSNKKND